MLERPDSKLQGVVPGKALPESYPASAFSNSSSSCSDYEDADLPLGSRHDLYAELLPDLFIRELSEIENVFRIRVAFVGGTSVIDNDERCNPLFHPALEKDVREKRILSVSKVPFLLTDPKAASTLGPLLKPDTLLYVPTHLFNPCTIVWLMLNLGLTYIILDMRHILEHRVFQHRFFQASKRAGLNLEAFISLYGGSAGYNWAYSVSGHNEVAEYGGNMWAQQDGQASEWFTCTGSESSEAVERVVGLCWCDESLHLLHRSDRREIIARNHQISGDYREFLKELQVDEDEEPGPKRKSKIKWLCKS